MRETTASCCFLGRWSSARAALTGWTGDEVWRMMQGTDRPSLGGDGSFGILDPRLNIFALANGMDLEKGDGTRKLTWFRDGWERGILLAESPEGVVSITPLAWQRGDAEPERRAPAPTKLAEADLAREIGTVLEQAVEAANSL